MASEPAWMSRISAGSTWRHHNLAQSRGGRPHSDAGAEKLQRRNHGLIGPPKRSIRALAASRLGRSTACGARSGLSSSGTEIACWPQ